MGRVVMYPENLAAVDGRPLLDRIGGQVADDAVGFAPELTGALKLGIHAEPAADDAVAVVAEAHHPDEPGDVGEYAYWAEVGTSDTPASRYLERALYRQRNP